MTRESKKTERALLSRWRDALRDSQLDTTAKLVGFTISTRWNGRGLNAFPAKTTIAKDASLRSVRAVDRAVQRLEHAGFLDVSRSKGRSSNGYTATLPTPSPDTGLTLYDETGSKRSNPVFGDAQPRTALHLTPSPGTGESAESAESVLGRADARREKSPRSRAAYNPDLSVYDQ